MSGVHTVTFWDDDELRAVWVFAEKDDALAFRDAANENGRKTVYDEQIILDHDAAEQAIADEVAGGRPA